MPSTSSPPTSRASRTGARHPPHSAQKRAVLKGAAIYARISDDAGGEGLGVARQIKDCHHLVEQLGWMLDGDPYVGRQSHLWSELADISLCYPEAPLVLLCWETPRLALRGECHRRWAAAWFEVEHGLHVPEAI